MCQPLKSCNQLRAPLEWKQQRAHQTETIIYKNVNAVNILHLIILNLFIGKYEYKIIIHCICATASIGGRYELLPASSHTHTQHNDSKRNIRNRCPSVPCVLFLLRFKFVRVSRPEGLFKVQTNNGKRRTHYSNRSVEFNQEKWVRECTSN